MWINFEGGSQFAVKVYVGGVNVISGESETETPSAILEKRRERLQRNLPLQDYMVTRDQRWLDGIATAEGKVSQFVAAPIGSWYSVEAQITGRDAVAGIQFEIIPRLPPLMPIGAYTIQVQTLTGKKIMLRGVCAADSACNIKSMIQDIEGIPPDVQRLIFNGVEMQDNRTLSYYRVTHVSIKFR